MNSPNKSDTEDTLELIMALVRSETPVLTREPSAEADKSSESTDLEILTVDKLEPNDEIDYKCLCCGKIPPIDILRMCNGCNYNYHATCLVMGNIKNKEDSVFYCPVCVHRGVPVLHALQQTEIEKNGLIVKTESGELYVEYGRTEDWLSQPYYRGRLNQYLPDKFNCAVLKGRPNSLLERVERNNEHRASQPKKRSFSDMKDSDEADA